MQLNGNYAQHYPQFFNPQFLGGFGTGWPQQGLHPQGPFSGPVGGFGGSPGMGQDSGYQAFGQPGFFGQTGQVNPLAGFIGQGPQGYGVAGVGNPHQIIAALGQLAHHVAVQGLAVQQIGALLGQLTVQIAAQSRAGQPGQSFQPQGFQPQGQSFGQGFGSPFGQSAFSPDAYGGSAPFAAQPQMWGGNRPLFS